MFTNSCCSAKLCSIPQSFLKIVFSILPEIPQCTNISDETQILKEFRHFSKNKNRMQSFCNRNILSSFNCFRQCYWAHVVKSFIQIMWQSGESHIILACEALQGCLFHTQTWYYYLLPMNLFTCGMFHTGVPLGFYYCHWKALMGWDFTRYTQEGCFFYLNICNEANHNY